MTIQELNIGKKVYIDYGDGNSLNDQYRFVSQIEDMDEYDNILVSAPIYKNIVLQFEEGQKLKVLYTHENGVYIFDGTVLGKIIENDLLFYKISVVTEVDKVQRREYFRVPISQVVAYRLNDSKEENYLRGITKDLSGGGIRFVCKQKLEKCQLLNIVITLCEDFEFKAFAEVIRCEYVDIDKYEISTKFVKLDFQKREQLIKRIFDIQREYLRKINKN